MDELLDQVHGKLFSFCDMTTRKLIRGLCHACALDIDVFTGLSVIVDDRFPTSLKFARSVKLNKMIIRSLRFVPNEQIFPDAMWFFDPHSFSSVREVQWVGLISFKWVEECLVNFSNLTKLYIGGQALDLTIFPYRQQHDGKPHLLTFPFVTSCEICSGDANYNILHPTRRRKIFSDSSSNSSSPSSASSSSSEEIIQDNTDKFQGFFSKKPSGTINKLKVVDDDTDVEKGRIWKDSTFVDDGTPVADNVYFLLLNLNFPKLTYFRLNYNEELYNIGGRLNWKGKPLQSFILRHASTLQSLILDGEQNDMEVQPVPLTSLSPVPENLRYLFVSIVEEPGAKNKRKSNVIIPFIKSVIGLKIAPRVNLWEELLRKQRSLEAIHCSVHAPWAWSTLTKAITKSCQFLHTINIGCHWSDPNLPMDIDIISRCIFLKKFTFNVTSDDPDKRCRIINLSSLLACVLLESIFITHALCETEELEVFRHLPSLTTLVLMYVGKMSDCGVTVGVLQDFLHIRSLNLLIVVEFYKQKHCINSHVLRRILKSSVNTVDCPIFSKLVPYASVGNFLYVGNITEAIIER